MSIDIDTSFLRRSVLQAGAMEIRDVDGGQKPFLYASGNWGPGYIVIKNLVGRKDIIKPLALNLAVKVAAAIPKINFVAGNVTGGVVPGWLVSEFAGQLLGRTIPFVYVRETRKTGGQKELVTGLANNYEIQQGDNVVVVEELVNFAQTTCNSSLHLRVLGYNATHTACILFYNNPKSVEALAESRLTMVHLFTLPELLETAEAEKTHDQRLIEAYRVFLRDPLGWQAERGLKRVEKGGTL